MIKPNKVRFVLSWLIYTLAFYVLSVLFLWISEKEFPYNFVWIIPTLFIFMTPVVYPYYTVTISGDKINGATQWGWGWKRAEIRIDEVDKEKLNQKRFGKNFGITVIHSVNGIKILTLGLSEQQLSEIITPVNKASE